MSNENNKIVFKVHRSTLKVLLNPVLRLLQSYTNKPYVIASVFDNKMEFITYSIQRVEKLKPPVDEYKIQKIYAKYTQYSKQ